MSQKEESNSGRVVGGLVISCEMERSDMKAGRRLEFMRRYVKLVKGGGELGGLSKFDSDQRLRWKCGKLMDLARFWQL